MCKNGKLDIFSAAITSATAFLFCFWFQCEAGILPPWYGGVTGYGQVATVYPQPRLEALQRFFGRRAVDFAWGPAAVGYYEFFGRNSRNLGGFFHPNGPNGRPCIIFGDKQPLAADVHHEIGHWLDHKSGHLTYNQDGMSRYEGELMNWDRMRWNRRWDRYSPTSQHRQEANIGVYFREAAADDLIDGRDPFLKPPFLEAGVRMVRRKGLVISAPAVTNSFEFGWHADASIGSVASQTFEFGWHVNAPRNATTESFDVGLHSRFPRRGLPSTTGRITMFRGIGNVVKGEIRTALIIAGVTAAHGFWRGIIGGPTPIETGLENAMTTADRTADWAIHDVDPVIRFLGHGYKMSVRGMNQALVPWMINEIVGSNPISDVLNAPNSLAGSVSEYTLGHISSFSEYGGQRFINFFNQ